jgi:hypothetical protein
LSNLSARFEGGGGREKREGEGTMTDHSKIADKRASRTQVEAELEAQQRTLPGKRHGVTCADLPWRFEP